MFDDNNTYSTRNVLVTATRKSQVMIAAELRSNVDYGPMENRVGVSSSQPFTTYPESSR